MESRFIMLERMDTFFENRLDGYDEHMLRDIEGAREFYPFTAKLLPMQEGAAVLDLGCGTGLELGFFFEKNPLAKVTGVDLSQGMLDALKAKFADKDLQLICGSYFEEELGDGIFDAAVSVESLHHFTKEEKQLLYTKLCNALKPGGHFILTDYFAPDEDVEAFFQRELLRLKKEQGISDKEFYHYDTPLTVQHETEALLDGGFSKVEVLKNWGATYTFKAVK